MLCLGLILFVCLVVVAVAWLFVLDLTVQPGDVNEGDECRVIGVTAVAVCLE